LVKNHGVDTQVCYLDSCILTYLMNDKELYNRIVNMKKIYALSQFNLYERQKNREYYCKTLDMLSEMPVLFFKHFEQMMDIEIKYFDIGKAPVIEMIFPFGMLLNEQGRVGARKYVESNEFFEMATQFDSEKEDILKSILQLRPNFEATNEKWSSDKKAKEFVYNALLERIGTKNPIFLQNHMKESAFGELPDTIDKAIHKGIFPDLYRFHSWATPLYFVYYKYYEGTDKPKKSDVIDIVMSSVYEYCDMVILEKNQANKAAFLKKKGLSLLETDIYTLKDKKDLLKLA